MKSLLSPIAPPHVIAAALAVSLVVGCSLDRTPRGSGSAPASSLPGAGGDEAVGGTSAVGGGGGAGNLTVESCYDGVDNDGDGAADCADDDCAATCADPCHAPLDISDPGDFNGDTAGHGRLIGTSCAVDGGPTHVFRWTAKHAGTVRAYLGSADDDVDLSLSIRTSCGDPASERACAEQVVGHEPPAQEILTTTVSQGETLYLVVQGHGAEDAGGYTLTVASSAPACGDGHLDANEECDDGNPNDGDGCTASCVFVPTETEPNDEPDEADLLQLPWYGRISLPRDTDFITMPVPSDGYGYVVNVFDLGDGACAQGRLDSYVLWFDPSQRSLAFDDDGGDGACSRLIVRDLAEGRHQLAISAAPGADLGFVYTLAVEGDQCGNGAVGGPEQCDDGNRTNGDGCSEYCTREGTSVQ